MPIQRPQSEGRPTQSPLPRRRPVGGFVIAGLWTIPALLTSVQTYLALTRRGLVAEPVTIVVFQGLVWLPWALMTPLILRCATAYPFRHGQRLKNAARHTVLAMAVTLVVIGYVAILESVNQGGWRGLAPEAVSAWLGRVAAGNSVLYFLLYWAVLGGCLAFATFRSLEQKERSHLALETQLARTQLAALESQLQPHFLFNTLNSVSALIDDEPAGARRMLARLAELLRASLRRGPVQEVTLQDELELLEIYLQIERTRFGDRLVVDYRLQPEVRNALVPFLILQPLVENAIRHGLAVDPSAGLIEISAHLDESNLYLSVFDDGPGPDIPGIPALEGQTAGTTASGIGLTNTRERLETLYPDSSSLDLLGRPEGGTEVRVVLPFRTGPDHYDR